MAARHDAHSGDPPQVFLLVDGAVSSYSHILNLYYRTLNTGSGLRLGHVRRWRWPATPVQWRALATRARGHVVVQTCLGFNFRPIRDAINVAVPLHEWSHCPSAWIRRLDGFDEIWAVSRHVASVVRRGGVRTPVHFVPPGLDVERYPAKASYHVRGSFRFLFCGAPHFRKGHHLLIEAFLEAFPREPGVRLTLKTSPGCQWKSPDARITLIRKDLSRPALLRLYANHDAFVSASLGEGLGLGVAEAILAGVPVATHDWGGHRDLLTPGGYLDVPRRIVDQPYCSLPELYSAGQKCALTDVEDLAVAMRTMVSADHRWRRSLAERARAGLVGRYGVDRSRARLARRLDALVSSRPTTRLTQAHA
jgi:glycosyltransferase involved in cell wall biosynthesis